MTLISGSVFERGGRRMAVRSLSLIDRTSLAENPFYQARFRCSLGFEFVLRAGHDITADSDPGYSGALFQDREQHKDRRHRDAER